MSNLQSHGGIFKHGGPHEPFAMDSTASYNDGVLGQLNPVVARCARRCAARGKTNKRCVARCIKRMPLLGLGEEPTVPNEQLSRQLRTLTLATGFTGLLIAGLLVQQIVSRRA